MPLSDRYLMCNPALFHFDEIIKMGNFSLLQ